jgi:hypothetical protein
MRGSGIGAAILLLWCISWAHINQKIADYARMKNAGNGLLVGGICLDLTGVILLITGISQLVNDTKNDPYYNDPYYNETSSASNAPPKGFGTVVAAEICEGIGIPMTIAGSVLSVIGKKKVEEYRGRVSVRISPNAISLTCAF